MKVLQGIQEKLQEMLSTPQRGIFTKNVQIHEIKKVWLIAMHCRMQ